MHYNMFDSIERLMVFEIGFELLDDF